MRLTDDALVGESRAKNHDSWMPWAACRQGVCGRDWAEEWLSELAPMGLPASDFVLNAVTKDGCKWLPRIAEHPDANAMLRLLLTMPPHNMAACDAATFDVHGLKKLYPTMGIQLKAVGALTDERSIERLGHWAKNSSMPDLYNDEACVAELHTRSVIAKAVGSGWKPAAFGCVPEAIPGSSVSTSSPSVVKFPMAAYKTDGGLVHLVEVPPWATCKSFKCGYVGERKDVTFKDLMDLADDAKWCALCGRVYQAG